MDLTDLDTFVHVVEAGSFTGAGRALGLPVSTISRRVARLEESLELTLFDRKGRFFKLTPVGELVFQRAHQPLRELALLKESLVDEESVPSGSVAVTMSTELGGNDALVKLFHDFQRTYPTIQLCVEVSNRFVDLVEESVDVALRMHTSPLQDSSALMRRRLLSLRVSLYASSAYVEERCLPSTVEQLGDHSCVSLLPSKLSTQWELKRGSETRVVPIQPVSLCNEFQWMRLSLLAGVGVGPLPDFLVHEDVEAGRLVKILPEWSLLSGHVSLVWKAARFLTPRVRVFLDFLSQRFPELVGKGGDDTGVD